MLLHSSKHNAISLLRKHDNKMAALTTARCSNLMTGGEGLYCDVLVAVTLSANFRRKEASPTNYCWCQKTTVIALSCGVKMSTVHCLILLQITRVTDGRTDGQNYDSQDRARIDASRDKNRTASMTFKRN